MVALPWPQLRPRVLNSSDSEATCLGGVLAIEIQCGPPDQN